MRPHHPYGEGDWGPFASFIMICIICFLCLVAFVFGKGDPKSTLFVGDSLGVGTAPYIKISHMKVVVKGGEPLRWGTAQLENYAHQDRLMISLGTNDSPESLPEVQDAVRYSLTRADCVVWATIHISGKDYGTINHWLRRREGKRFRVVQWNHEVNVHPELLYGDGIHATPHGYYVRSRMYVKKLHECPS